MASKKTRSATKMTAAPKSAKVAKTSKSAAARAPAARPAAKKAPAAPRPPAKKIAPKPAPKQVPVKKAATPAAAPRKTPPSAPVKPARPAAPSAPARRPAAAPRKVPPSAPARPARPVAPPAPARRSASAPAPEPPAKPVKVRRLPAKLLATLHKQLLELKDRIVDRINFLASENLNHSHREASGDLSNYGMHMADQGTDNFDQEFALNMVSNEQDILYEIDEALHRMEAGTYGTCEMTGQPIEIQRLRAMPHARFCMAAQTESEKGRKRYRPLGPSGFAGGSET